MSSRDVRVAPSILSADFARLGEDCLAVLDAGADWLHIDAMDGRFVPNLTFGAPIVASLRPLTEAPLDCHLMVEAPGDRVDEFLEAGADGITVHAEAATHLQRTLTQIREGGARAGVALNPHTPVSVLEHVIDDVDLVLVMTVNPGFGGQAFLETMVPKVQQARELLDRAGSQADLQVDGGISPTTAPQVLKAGADVLVAGSAIFKAQATYAEQIQGIRGA